MRNSRLINAFFITFLTIPLIAAMFGRQATTVENRTFAEFPTVSTSSVWSADTYAQIAAYLTDRLPFREIGIEADARIDLYVFGDNPNPDRVVFGPDGWLFTRFSLTNPCTESDLSVDALVERLAYAKTIVESAGRMFRAVIGPDKVNYFDENSLTSEADNCPSSEIRVRMQNALEERLGPTMLPLFETFERVGPEDTYYKTDSHWTPFGSSLMVRDLVESLDVGLWDDSALQVQADSAGRDGGLFGALGMSRFEPSAGVTVERPDTEVTNVEEWTLIDGFPVLAPLDQRQMVLNGGELSYAQPYPVLRLNARRHITSSGPAMIDAPAVFVHDSFLWDAALLIPQYFADTTLLHWDIVGTQAASDDLGRAEIVVVEIVERNLYATLEADELTIPLIAAFAEELPGRRIPLRARMARPDQGVTFNALDSSLVAEPNSAPITINVRASDGGGDRFLVLTTSFAEPSRLRVTPDGSQGEESRVTFDVDATSRVVVIDLRGIDPDVTRFQLRSLDSDMTLLSARIVELP